MTGGGGGVMLIRYILYDYNTEMAGHTEGFARVFWIPSEGMIDH